MFFFFWDLIHFLESRKTKQGLPTNRSTPYVLAKQVQRLKKTESTYLYDNVCRMIFDFFFENYKMQKVRANFGISPPIFFDIFVIFSILYLSQVNKCFRSIFLVDLMFFAILYGLIRWGTQIPSLSRKESIVKTEPNPLLKYIR